MGVIPKTTTPLTKFIRTGEGVLVFAFNLAMLIVPIVSNALSPEDAVKWAGIINGIAVISRTGLKVVSEVSKTTGIEPQPIGNFSQVITADTGSSASNGGAPEVVDVQELASTPTVDDDVVEVPTPGPVQAADAQVSDEEEFSSVPPASDYDVDGIAPVSASGDGDPAGTPELVGAGASGVPNPIVINAGEELS